MWDRTSGEEIKKIELSSSPCDLQVSKDSSLLVVPYGRNVSFWDINTLDKIKEYNIPTQVNSAAIHPDKSVFICGGEDFKMYKYDYATGNELDSFKGHFGPIHCLSFSPDGELYASGSEDGTLRLWQTTVGKTYGLWKYVDPNEASNETSVTNAES
ncbi:STRAP (predicted) [Pycnogonum litorale]